MEHNRIIKEEAAEKEGEAAENEEGEERGAEIEKVWWEQEGGVTALVHLLAPTWKFSTTLPSPRSHSCASSHVIPFSK